MTKKKLIPDRYNQTSIEIYQKINIKNQNQLIDFLTSYSNAYHTFILQKLKELIPIKNNKPGYRIEKHHIIPKHINGPNEPWNIVVLTFEDHTLAHFLLTETFFTLDDYAVYLWRSGFDVDKRDQHSRRMKQISIFKDSTSQSEFGKKGGKTFTLRRKKRISERQNLYVNMALKKGMIWYFKPLNLYILVKAEMFIY